MNEPRSKSKKLKELEEKDKKGKRGVMIRRLFAIAMIVGTLFPIVWQIVASAAL